MTLAEKKSSRLGTGLSALFGEETASVPASLLRRCSPVTFCGTEEVMNGIL